MIKRLLTRIEDANIPFVQMAVGFVGIVVVRFFFEDLSSPPQSFGGVFDTLTLVHYLLFYLGTFLSLALAIRIFIPDIRKISKFLLFGFPIIWVSPIYDLVVTHGVGYRMAYVFMNSASLWANFTTFGGLNPIGGMTPGLHTELSAIMIGIFLYVFLKSKNVLKSIGAFLAAYMVLLIWMTFPSFVTIFHELFTGTVVASPSSFFVSIFSASRSAQDFLRPTITLTPTAKLETTFNLGMAYVLYLVDLALLIGWMAASEPRIIKSLLKGSRPGRILHYFLLFDIGLIIAVAGSGSPLFLNGADVAVLVITALAFLFAFLYILGVNNIADVSIDAISNQSQPLVAGTLSEGEVRSANIFFLSWALIGGYISGYWELFLVGIFIAAYYIYSAHPLRLKRVPLLSTFLIAIACLAALMGGFYFVDTQKLVVDFPPQIVALVLICFTFAANIKDIKDIEGDRAGGIATIPVLFPRAGKPIVGGLLAVSFLIIPVILASWPLFWPSFIAAAIGYYFVVAEPYREWRIFVLYFCYAGALWALLTPR